MIFKKAFEYVKNYIKNNKHCLLALAWLIDFIVYKLCQAINDGRTQIKINIPLDDKIPFIEYFYIPYVLWFVYIFAVSVYLLAKSKKGFIDLYKVLIIGMVLCYTTSLVFPLYFERAGSPMLYARDNYFTYKCKGLHDYDKPTNLMPSLHVYMSVAIAWAFAKYGDKKHLIWKILSFVLATLICLSTVFIKQHSILDGIVGIFAAVIFCIVIFYDIIPNKKTKKQNQTKTAIDGEGSSK